jgi:uncharacterized protein YbaR (Trm112 family)
MMKVILVCPFCGNFLPIVRRRHRPKSLGHQKDLWCPYCQRDVTATQITDGNGDENTRHTPA